MKTNKKIIRVTFFGGSEARPGDRHYDLAFATAKLLAENGYVVVNGGGEGIMTAATLGAKAGEGKVEVALVERSKYPGNFVGENKENTSVCDKKIVCKDYDKRTNKLIELGDAFCIFSGGTGTIDEMGRVWSLAKFDHGHHEPLIFMGPDWKKIIKKMMENLRLEEMEKDVVAFAKNEKEVLKLLGH